MHRLMTGILAIALFLVVLVPMAVMARVNLDAAEITTWADETFNHLLDEHRFSGLGIAVVQDGEIIFSKGYGWEDLARKIPVDPRETRFRIGSNSKIFTATGLMQLKDRGLIGNLDDPVNKYLKRTQLPKAFGKEITLWDLFTHRAGFEDRAEGLGAEREVPDYQSREIIDGFQPEIVRKTGLISSYSNYSTSVLGAVLEDLSGQTAQDYLAEHIFGPLGMSRSVLNTSPEPTERLGVPYAFFPNGEAQEVPHLGIHPFVGPAGAINAPVEDVARFQMAHLDAGRGSETPILTLETFALMQTRHAGNHPVGSGFGVQFMITDWNGEKLFGHGGGWPGFQSIMMMMPDSNAAYVMAVMGDQPRAGFLEQIASTFMTNRLTASPGIVVKRPLTLKDLNALFLRRFLGDQRPPAGARNGPVDKYVGEYLHERRSRTRREAMLELFGGGVLHVGTHGDGGLTFNGIGPYRETAPGVFFKHIDDFLDMDPSQSEIYAFTLDDGGNAIRASAYLDVDVFTRVSGFQNPLVIAGWFEAFALVCLTGFLAAFWRRGEGPGRKAKWLPVAMAGTILSLPLIVMAGFGEMDGMTFELLSGRGTRFGLLQTAFTLLAIMALTAAVLAYLAWRDGYWGEGKRAVARRIHFTAIAAAGLGLIPIFNSVNLLGF